MVSRVLYLKQDNIIMKILNPKENIDEFKWTAVMVLSEPFLDPDNKYFPDRLMVFVTCTGQTSPIPVYQDALYFEVEGEKAYELR